MYAIWRACERFALRPPDVRQDWDENSFWVQAQLIAYNQIREHEEGEELGVLAGVGLHGN
jgi:hypothetical protein